MLASLTLPLYSTFIFHPQISLQVIPFRYIGFNFMYMIPKSLSFKFNSTSPIVYRPFLFSHLTILSNIAHLKSICRVIFLKWLQNLTIFTILNVTQAQHLTKCLSGSPFSSYKLCQSSSIHSSFLIFIS